MDNLLNELEALKSNLDNLPIEKNRKLWFE